MDIFFWWSEIPWVFFVEERGVLQKIIFSQGPFPTTFHQCCLKSPAFLLRGSSQDWRKLLIPFNNHGDCCCPVNGVLGPLPHGHSWLIHGGDPNYLLSGMILQVIPSKNGMFKPPMLNSARGELWSDLSSPQDPCLVYLPTFDCFFGKCR